MTSIAATLLARTIDDYIAWLTAWTRIACYEVTDHTAQADALPEPESFAQWRAEAFRILQDQPALQQQDALYDQLHRVARLAILKAPEGSPITRSDYVAVTMKFQEFIAGLRRMERALAAAASGLDTLTGLRSRTGLQEDLQREQSRFRRGGKGFCLALMDIDHFKKINDTYGHDEGDRVLSAVANHISRSLRPFDDAWRWGGEEFLLCLKEVDLTSGAAALERVRRGLESLPIMLGTGGTINITASFGIVAANLDRTVEELMKEADDALYRAKEKGRNRVELALV